MLVTILVDQAYLYCIFCLIQHIYRNPFSHKRVFIISGSRVLHCQGSNITFLKLKWLTCLINFIT